MIEKHSENKEDDLKALEKITDIKYRYQRNDHKGIQF